MTKDQRAQRAPFYDDSPCPHCGCRYGYHEVGCPELINEIVEKATTGFADDVKRIMADHPEAKPGDLTTEQQCQMIAEASAWRARALKAESALAAFSDAERVGEEEETYQIGKRDGYESAVQDIDMRTGGDGEYFASTMPGRGCPDAPSMIQGIVDRFASLNQPAASVVEEGTRVTIKGERDVYGDGTVVSVEANCTNVRWDDDGLVRWSFSDDIEVLPAAPSTPVGKG